MNICLDSNILIWGVRKESSPGQEDNIEYAKYFLEDLKKRGVTIIIPTPVLAEILIPVPKNLRNGIISDLSSFTRIEGFDLSASLKFAELFANLKKQDIESYKKETTKTRNALKIDLMVISIAIIKKCKIIYTGNIKEYKKLAIGEEIEILDMPKHSFERNLEFPKK